MFNLYLRPSSIGYLMGRLEDRVDIRTRELASLVQQVTDQSLKFRQIYEVIFASRKLISIDLVRAEVIGGRLHIKSAPGEGTRVAVVVNT